MTTHDRYVAAPRERRPRGRLDGLRPWIALAVVVLLLLGPFAIGLVNGRQDPALQVPVDLQDPALPIPTPS